MASIVAKGYDGSYKVLSLDLLGKVDSATTAELVGAAVAGAAGMGHRDQVTDCKSILAIDARAREARPPLKLPQRVLISSAKSMQQVIRWHRAHPERDALWSLRCIWLQRVTKGLQERQGTVELQPR